MIQLSETSLVALWDSAVRAFPGTTRRQNSTDTVRIEHLDWVPFLGVRTLMVRGLSNNEGRKNSQIVLFKGVKYKDSEGRGTVSLAASDGKEVHLEAISKSSSDVLVRCSCEDFRWRFMHWNRGDGSLFGRDARRYEASLRPGSSNPEEAPGLCKHLMKMAKILHESGVLKA